MAVSVNISIAEMLIENIRYSAQNLKCPAFGQYGGRGVSEQGHDQPVVNNGSRYWVGTVGLAQTDKASENETASVESIIMRIQDSTLKFACPIIRDSNKLIKFKGTKNSVTIDIDSDLVDDFLTITGAGAEASDGSVSMSYSASLKTPDATITNIVAIIPQGCYLSVDGLLFMTTVDNSSTALTGLLPNKELARLVVGEKILWRKPWIVARVPIGSELDLPRSGAYAGPWSFPFEEAS